MVKNANWQEADQLVIYMRGRGVELGATEKQLHLVVRAGLEPGTSGFQVRRPNHSTTLPPYSALRFRFNALFSVSPVNLIGCIRILQIELELKLAHESLPCRYF